MHAWNARIIKFSVQQFAVNDVVEAEVHNRRDAMFPKIIVAFALFVYVCVHLGPCVPVFCHAIVFTHDRDVSRKKPDEVDAQGKFRICLLYTSPSPRD